MGRLLDFLCDTAFSPWALTVFLALAVVFTFILRLAASFLRRVDVVGWALLKASLRGAVVAMLGIALTAALARIGQNSAL